MALELDKEGHLQDLSDWNKAVAEELAAAEGIELSEAHWEIIELIRAFYASFQVSPAMRPLIKQIRTKLGEEKASSVHLMTLFGGSPARMCAKIAGLPRPTNCI
jgi:tRNA 2-thiouridine synthesizing protein E